MKIVIIIPDGMADLPIPELNSKTPMEAADKPYMNKLAGMGIMGTVCNVPDGMVPESDTANLSVLGYDPKIYSKGRSPLEAMSIGLDMRKNDIAFRTNLITLTEDEDIYEEKIILDHSADEITTEEADILIKEIDRQLGSKVRRFHTGISYRHCLLWENSPGMYDFGRPHDILNKKIKEYLPSGEVGSVYLELMKKSYDILKNHEVNIKRKREGKKPANSIWLWSPGVKPELPDFNKKYQLNGSVICAVDLIKGIGKCAGLNVVNVEGATGNFHTNYKNKGEAAINELRAGKNFIFVHIEAPDECGHRGELENKIKSIEKIDEMVIGPIYEYLNSIGEEYRIIILPDHPTPIALRTHTRDFVPFLMYSNKFDENNIEINFSEKSASESNIKIEEGYNLLDTLCKI